MASQNVSTTIVEADIQGFIAPLQQAIAAMNDFANKLGQVKPKPIEPPAVPKPDTSGFLSSLKEAEHGVEGFFASFKAGSFSGMLEGIKGIASAAPELLLLGAAAVGVYEGLKKIGEAVTETVKWNLEAGKLSRQLGISQQDASVLANTLEDNGIAVETYTGAVNFMVRALQKGSPAFDTLGVSTRNVDGSFRNAQDIMTDVIDAFGKLEDSTGKTVLGQQLFGRQWMTSQEVLRLTSETLAKNAEQMAHLGTKVTPESEANARKYSLALAEVHDVVAAFAINIGNKLIPVLTEVAEWFAGKLTIAVEYFRMGLDFLVGVFSKLYEVLAPVVGALVDGLGAALDVVWTLIKGNFDAISLWIGAIIDAIPGLRTLVDWLGGGGEGGLTGAINVLIGVLKIFASGLIVIAGIFEMLMRLVDMFATLLMGLGRTIATAFIALAKGSFLDAQKAWSQGLDDMEAKLKIKGAALEAGVERTMNRVNDLWAKKPDIGAENDESAGLDLKGAKKKQGITPPDTDGGKKWLAARKAELEDEKSKEENWFTWNAARELIFWEEKLAIVSRMGKAYKEARDAIQKEVNKLRKEAFKEELEKEGETIKQSMEARNRAFDQEVTEIRQRAAAKAEALKDAAKLETTKQKGAIEIASIGASDEEKRALTLQNTEIEFAAEDKLAKELARIREKELQDVIEKERAKLQARLVSLEAARSDARTDAKAQERILGEEKAAQQAFDKLSEDLNAKNLAAEGKDHANAALRKLQLEQATSKKIALDQEALSKKVQGYMEPFVSGFQNGIKKILDGSLSLGDAVAGMGKMLAGAFSDMVSKMVTDWIQGLAEMLSKWIATKIMELFFHKTTEEQKSQATLTGVATQGAAGAVLAGVNAAGSAAAVPGVGWMIAIPVAVAVIGGLMALLGGMKHAAGGFDVPAGLNPLTQLHAEEMVLPAPLANAVRDMAAGGGRGGGGGEGGGMTQHVHIHTMDRQSFADALKRHDGALRKELMGQARAGKFGRIGGGGKRRG